MGEEQLIERTYSNKSKLLKHLRMVRKPVLLIIPAISVGKPGLSDQYRDYLDQSAKLYKYLSSHDQHIDLFVLGAEHRGDGFLHQIGVEYLSSKYEIPQNSCVWSDNNFQKLGLCSAEEAQLTAKYLTNVDHQHHIVTCISQSQLDRYYLHQKGYGIESVYFVFPDNHDYYHVQNIEQEKILLEITKKDPRWESDIGLELRGFAHQLRDPNEVKITQKEIQSMQKRLTKLTN